MEKLGRHKRGFLESIMPDKRTPEQQKILDDFYDSEPSHPNSAEFKEARKKHWEKTFEEPNKLRGLEMNEFYRIFNHYFKENEGTFLTKESFNDYKILLHYFCKDERFFDCANLTKFSSPDLDKGLLIIGGYGNGKTSYFRALQKTVALFDTDNFGFHSANNVVAMYERCKEYTEKDAFWKKMITGIKCFDDVKTEREASNFGKANLFKDIIERRYEKRLLTHITCNYQTGNMGNVDSAMDEFGDKYGSRVYDRLKEMFNVIVFKGNSQRK